MNAEGLYIVIMRVMFGFVILMCWMGTLNFMGDAINKKDAKISERLAYLVGVILLFGLMWFGVKGMEVFW